MQQSEESAWQPETWESFRQVLGAGGCEVHGVGDARTWPRRLTHRSWPESKKELLPLLGFAAGTGVFIHNAVQGTFPLWTLAIALPCFSMASWQTLHHSWRRARHRAMVEALLSDEHTYQTALDQGRIRITRR